jgi:hypothetical protein
LNVFYSQGDTTDRKRRGHPSPKTNGILMIEMALSTDYLNAAAGDAGSRARSFPNYGSFPNNSAFPLDEGSFLSCASKYPLVSVLLDCVLLFHEGTASLRVPLSPMLHR